MSTAAETLDNVGHLVDESLREHSGPFLVQSGDSSMRSKQHSSDLTESTQCRSLGVQHSGVQDR
ncbi:MAG: hypothetical protein JW779_11830, partial [Candidatus Thorarchaeota archaeon]|nr:hypothetical protein [Candidatus Thorarchaeota archaeon]